MHRVVKARVRGICLAGLMAFVSQAVAEVAHDQADRDKSCPQVDEWLEAGRFPGELISTMMNSGMTRAEGTVLTMVCAGNIYGEAIARAGVQESVSLMEARSVAAAVLAMAGDTGPVADAVRTELANQEKLARQPSVYEGDYDPGGGGVSPST